MPTRRELLKSLGASVALVPGLSKLLQSDEPVVTDSEESLEDSFRTLVTDYIEACDHEDDREQHLDDIYMEIDGWWGDNVKSGRIDQYDIDDLMETLPACIEIFEFAGRIAWIEDDNGLWDGLVYGVIPAIAYHSLSNVFYQLLNYDLRTRLESIVAELS
jgi:hypothetical protein